ncbi:HVO_2523 family zinc finger protein [Natrononativus amylolyticus]|uniref:HVO_2523 family zinc finger protein n=1 Tax=Natrononativus amylolyticus TaxID=2963434 RepID=UPI0020CE1736|nr:HVO_2523 family zinc finger protein [Natrononativus amylolyticus]
MSDGGENGRRTSTARSDRPTGAPTCPHCRAPMYKRHCKYVCPQHGVIIDCSDPFR